MTFPALLRRTTMGDISSYCKIQANIIAATLLCFAKFDYSPLLFSPFLRIRSETIGHNLQPSRQLCCRCRVHYWAPWWEPQQDCSWWSSWSCWLSNSAIDPDLRRTLMTTAAWRTWRRREPALHPRVTNRRPCPSVPIASRALRRIPI